MITTPPGIEWGIKRSLIRYLSLVPDVQSSITDGAEPTEDGCYRYALASVTGDTVDGRVRGVGSVRFMAHHGSLRLGFSDPELDFHLGRVVVTVTDHFGVDGGRLELVRGRLDADTRSSRTRITDVRLTRAGADLFNHLYEAGELFDDIVVNVRPPLLEGNST